MSRQRDLLGFQGVGGLLVLALLSTAAPLYGQNDEADLGRLLAGTQIVVVPFRNIAGDPDANWIGQGSPRYWLQTWRRPPPSWPLIDQPDQPDQLDQPGPVSLTRWPFAGARVRAGSSRGGISCSARRSA